MKMPDSILDEAFAIYEEFGPNRRIERRERLKSVFQQLSAEEIEFLQKKMKEVSQTVWAIAERGGDAKLGEAKVIELLQEKHPFLQSVGMEHVRFL